MAANVGLLVLRWAKLAPFDGSFNTVQMEDVDMDENEQDIAETAINPDDVLMDLGTVSEATHGGFFGFFSDGGFGFRVH